MDRTDEDRPFDPEGDDDCPNPDCFRGQVDDLTKPKGCPCCSYVMKDCPTCDGTGQFPRNVVEAFPA